MTSPAFRQTTPVAGSYETTLLPGEEWWDGLSHDAGKMPYTSQTKLARDIWGNNDKNQAQPLLISSRGATSGAKTSSNMFSTLLN